MFRWYLQYMSLNNIQSKIYSSTAMNCCEKQQSDIYKNIPRLGFLKVDGAEYLKNTNNFDVCYFHKYPFNILCNFYPSNFKVDNVEVNSMEAFIQALKVPDVQEQQKVCKMFGPSSKKIGNYFKYYGGFDRKTLHWAGQKYDRYSQSYIDLLQKAYNSKYRDDKEFRSILQLTEGYNLTHKIGKSDKDDTILTEDEFMDQLNKLRSNNVKKKIPIQDIITTYANQDLTINKLKDLEKLNIENLFMLDDKIVCGSPITSGKSKELLSQIKQAGIKTIIDVGGSENQNKKALCEKYGLKYFSIPFNDFKNQSNEIKAKLPEFINIMQNSTSYIECEKSLNDASIAMCANFLFNPEAYLGNAIMFPENTKESKIKLINDIQDFIKQTQPPNKDIGEKIKILKDMNELEYYK